MYVHLLVSLCGLNCPFNAWIWNVLNEFRRSIVPLFNYFLLRNTHSGNIAGQDQEFWTIDAIKLHFKDCLEVSDRAVLMTIEVII